MKLNSVASAIKHRIVRIIGYSNMNRTLFYAIEVPLSNIMYKQIIPILWDSVDD